MSAVMWFGAHLVVCGVVTLALAAIYRGQLINSHVDPIAGRTLEPWRMRGGGRNWPGLLLIAIGAINHRRTALKISDREQAEDAIRGASGKRLTYQQTDEAGHA